MTEKVTDGLQHVATSCGPCSCGGAPLRSAGAR